MIALQIARLNVLRLLRDRTALFFVFLLPVILIVVLGTVYGGRVAPRLGVVSTGSGPLGEELVTALRAGDLRLEIKPRATESELRDGVETGALEMGLVIPAGYDATASSGGTATLTVYGRPESAISALRSAIDAAVAEQSARIGAARFAVERGVMAFGPALVASRIASDSLPGVELQVSVVGEGIFPEGTGAFAPGAQSQLILFMFLTSMTAATQLILTRQLGVSRRMVASPTSVGTILVGETLGRFGVAMVQGLFIVVLSALAFGVAWGDPVAAGLIVVAFALVGTGVAMVLGVFANNPEQAGTLGVLVGMGLGAIGGAMVPLEVFGEPLRTIAHLTPQAWAIDALREVALHYGGVVDVLPQLAVLFGFAVVLLAIGTWRFRRVLTS